VTAASLILNTIMELRDKSYKLNRDHTRTVRFYTDEHGTTGISDLKVCKSAAGFYIGRTCDEGPYSRDSEYYRTEKECTNDLRMTNEL
jgi:hypothetical protein